MTSYEKMLANEQKPKEAKARWKACRLLRFGYKFASGNADLGIWYYYFEPYGYYDPCALMVEINEKSYQSKASFRLADQDVHLTRYVTLNCEDGWCRLDEFRNLYRKLRHSAVANIFDASEDVTDK